MTRKTGEMWKLAKRSNKEFHMLWSSSCEVKAVETVDELDETRDGVKFGVMSVVNN